MVRHLGNTIASILALVGLIFLAPAMLLIYAGFTLFCKLEERYE
jgi:hypothetical protein